VTVHRAAVSDKPGRAKLFLDRHRSTQHSLASANVGKSGPEENVAVITLDELLEQSWRCDLIKIDAQGTEARILRGGRRLLKKFHPAIVLELWPRGLDAFGDRPADLFQSLESLGYQLARLSAKGSLKSRSAIDEFLHQQGRWRSINVAAIPRNRPLADRIA
jgi:hypothetical protein